jgi:hypothetical protein
VYADIRRRFAVEAADSYAAILPLPPSSIGKSRIERCISLVGRSLTTLRRDEVAEVIRTEHVPALDRELTRLRTADAAEDEVAASCLDRAIDPA